MNENIGMIIAKLLALLQEYREEVTNESQPDWFWDMDSDENVSIFYWKEGKKISIPFSNFEKMLWDELNSLKK